MYHAYHQCKRISRLWSRTKPFTDTTQHLTNGALNSRDKELTRGNEDEGLEPLLRDDS